MSDNILFSLIIPTYNRADLITDTIQSALQQDYPYFEIIVVDDGSTDNTEEVVRRIESPKLTYYRIKNSERGAARNFGASRAKGDYLNFFDSDDLLYRNHLSVAHQMVIQFNKPEIFYLNCEVENGDSKKMKKITGDVNRQLFNGNILSCNGVFLRMDIANRFPFVEDRNLAGTEDWELWLRLASRYKIYYSNEVTSLIVNHPSRSVLIAKERELNQRTELLIHYLSGDKHFYERFGNHLYKIRAHMLSYTSLHLALSGNVYKAFEYLILAVKVNFFELFKRRTLAIIKHCILKSLP